MVLLLATALDVPLRERNALLLAAGFAPMYKETRLDAPELASVRDALDAILRQQEPFPSVVMNRYWDVLDLNQAAKRFFTFLLGREPAGQSNVIRVFFDPNGVRPYVANWESVAESLIQRIHREAVGGVPDRGTRELLEAAFAYPNVPQRFRVPDVATPLVPVIPVSFLRDGRKFNFFSAVTTLGTPQDITLQEIRIESFFPADADTARNARQLSATDPHVAAK